MQRARGLAIKILGVLLHHSAELGEVEVRIHGLHGVERPLDQLVALRQRPGSLFELIEPFLATPEAARILRNGKPPDLAEVANWINSAKHARPLRAA